MLDAVVRAGAAQVGPEYERVVEWQRAGGESLENAASLARFLASPESEGISGRLISAVWDPWHGLAAHAAELATTDIYTLRRITPEERGKQWKS
jgi:3-oxoacyl-[acyl-carrier protein] reductase